MAAAAVPASPPRSTASDFGPELRLARREVVVEDAPDPDRPRRTIRRARVADPLSRMAKRGELSARHLAAAEALRALHGRCGFGGPGSPMDRLGMPSAPAAAPGAGPLGAAELLARGELRRVLLGLSTFGPVVRWVVLDGGRLDDFARASRRRRQAISLHFHDAMEALASWWDTAANTRRLTRDG